MKFSGPGEMQGHDQDQNPMMAEIGEAKERLQIKIDIYRINEFM